MRLTGNQCLCAACGRTFTGLTAFDKHRHFVPGTDERACRDEDWLTGHGITRRDNGVYGFPRMTAEQKAARGWGKPAQQIHDHENGSTR